MTASMYILLVLALIFANAPFVTAKFFGVLPLKRKHFGHHLVELATGFLLTAILAYILESRAGGTASRLGVLRYRSLPLPDICLPLFRMALFLACAQP